MLTLVRKTNFYYRWIGMSKLHNDLQQKEFFNDKRRIFPFSMYCQIYRAFKLREKSLLVNNCIGSVLSAFEKICLKSWCIVIRSVRIGVQFQFFCIKYRSKSTA